MDSIAPEIVPQALWDGRGIVPFHAIDYPRMVSAGDADFIEESEYVLGLTVNGESRAYPTRFVWWHHFINDRVEKEGREYPEYTIAYCSVCNTGIRFDPRLFDKQGKPQSAQGSSHPKRIFFDFYGLYNGVVTMCDRDTETVWLEVTGRAVKGARTGAQLKMTSLLDTTWGEWKALHPNTLVMAPEKAYARYYGDPSRREPRGYDRFPMPFFEQSLTKKDDRLPMFDKVLAVTLPATDIAHPDPNSNTTSNSNATEDLHRAYPVADLQKAKGVLNDTLGAEPVVAFLVSDTATGNAFSRRIDGKIEGKTDGKTLTFETRDSAGGKVAFFDHETGTRWNIEGVGVEGPLAGKSLRRLDNHLSQWYGWVAYYPNTSIFGRTDAPRTQNIEVKGFISAGPPNP